MSQTDTNIKTEKPKPDKALIDKSVKDREKAIRDNKTIKK